MDVKESVTKFIKTNEIINKIKSIPKLLSVGLISLAGLFQIVLLPTKSITAYAQQLQPQTSDPWYESLNIARSKVEAALSPGAWGHGVPGLHNLTTQDILMVFGITGVAAVGAYVGIRKLLEHVKSTVIYP